MHDYRKFRFSSFSRKFFPRKKRLDIMTRVTVCKYANLSSASLYIYTYTGKYLINNPLKIIVSTLKKSIRRISDGAYYDNPLLLRYYGNLSALFTSPT